MDWSNILKKLRIPQRKYLRPKPPSKTEKALGYVVLLIVVGIGVIIYMNGRRYNPDLFRLDPTLLTKAGDDKTGVKVAGGERRSNRTFDGEPTGQPGSGATTSTPSPGASPTPAASSAASGDDSFIPTEIAGLNWKRRGQLEKFNVDNLYDKVDGRENLYKSYQFQALVAADYVASDNQDRFIQVELYDMTSAKSALGVFSAERPAHPNPAKIGNDAYVESNGAFFWKGKYYVRVIGSDSEKSTEQAANTIAKSIAEKLPESKETVAIVDPLPKQNQIANSFSIIPDSAFGQALFKNVYSARYKIDGVEMTGFVMENDSPDKAQTVIKQYQESMASFGKFNQVSTDPAIYYLEAFGSHYVIFAKGKTIGGVMEADKKDPAIKLTKELADNVK